MHSTDGLYPGTAGTRKITTLQYRQLLFTSTTAAVGTAAFYAHKLTMSGAQARATALVIAYVKGTSPGTALLDDEVDSSSAPMSGDVLLGDDVDSSSGPSSGNRLPGEDVGSLVLEPSCEIQETG